MIWGIFMDTFFFLFGLSGVISLVALILGVRQILNQKKNPKAYVPPSAKAIKTRLALLFIFIGLVIGFSLCNPLESRSGLGTELFVGFAFIWLLYVGACYLVGNAATTKGRSWDAFFLLSVFVSPLIMGIIAASVSATAEGVIKNVKPDSPAASVSQVPDQLRQLMQMREQGLVSESEFEAKKAEILSRL